MKNLWRRYLKRKPAHAGLEADDAEHQQAASDLRPDPSAATVRRERLVWLAAGVVIHLALLSALVHSLLADWPGRLWLVLGVIASIVVSALLGQRWYRAPLWIGAGALALLLLTASYLYGTEGAGLRILGLRFDTLVALLFLAAIGLAVWRLARLPRIPWWARLIPVALGLHAVVPVVIGLFERVPFEEVLVGLWTLPYWAQGAWVGAAVLLPAALVVSLTTTLVPAWRPDPFRKATAVATSLALLWMTLITGIGMNARGLVNLAAFLPVPEQESAEAAQVEVSKGMERDRLESPDDESALWTPEDEEGLQAGVPFAELTAEEREQEIEELERLFDALEAAAEEIPRDTFDPQAIVDKVGTDPVKLFEWVRDNTYLVPYRGTLRGPIGVLMDRRGNSLDRALLLHDLLVRAGEQARLARGTLAGEELDAALQATYRLRSEEVQPADHSAPASGAGTLDEYVTEFSLDGVTLGKQMQELSSEQQQRIHELVSRTQSQTEWLLTMLEGAGINPRLPRAPTSAQLLSDHWWVQWRDGDTWFDLDPSTVDPGTLLTAPEAVLNTRDLGNDLKHTVGIRVLVERWQDSRLSEQTALEHVLLPSDVIGQRLILRLVPLHWPEDFSIFEGRGARERFRVLVLEEREWLPVLTIGSSNVSQQSFTDRGEVRPIGREVPEGEMGARIRGGFAFPGGPEESERGEGEPESYLTAAWIEYEVSIPGQSPYRMRRAVFDLLGSDRRSDPVVTDVGIDEVERLTRGLALLTHHEVVVLAAQSSVEFQTVELSSRVGSAREAFLELMGGTAPSSGIVASERAMALSGLFTPAEAFGYARNLSGLANGQTFLSRPNIVTYRVGLESAQGGEVTAFEELDIVENSVSALGGRDGKAFATVVGQGVFDTNLEGELLVRQGAAAVNLGELLGQGEAKKARFTVFRSVKDPSWRERKGSYPARVRAMLASDLQQHVVVAPTRPFEVDGRGRVFGWWRVDPVSGATVGMLEDGRGASLVKYVKIITAVTGLCMLSGLCFVLLGDKAAYERCIASGERTEICLLKFAGGTAWRSFKVIAWFAVVTKVPLAMIAFIMATTIPSG